MKIRQFANTIFGLILLTMFGYGAYLLFVNLFEVLSKLKPEVLIAVIGSMATISAVIAAAIINQRHSKQRDIDESHRPKKVEIYKGFLDTVSGVMARENENVSKKGPSNQDLVDYVVEFKTDILLWGSPQVIKCQLEFEKVSNKGGNTFAAMNKLYKAIRKDIGLSNKGLNNYELIKIYLKDPSELDTMINASK